MKRASKFISILLLVFSVAILGGCGTDAGSTANGASGKKSVKDAAEAYIGAYLNKDVDFNKAGLSKDDVLMIVYKRDNHVVNLYSKQDGKDSEILRAFYEGLNKVEYKVKSGENDKVTVSIKGIDISKIANDVKNFGSKTRRDKKGLSKEEFFLTMEDKAMEELKGAELREEIDVDLNFEKNDYGKYILKEESINSLENAISYMKDDYTRFDGDISNEFKSIEEAK